jgi:hypothetical protein
MELLLMITASVLLALAAQRWGYDSRPGFVSKEHELARHGVTWRDRGAAGLLAAFDSPFVLGAAGARRMLAHPPRFYARQRLLRRGGGRGPRSRWRG